jgi:hypothetical protein
MIAVGKNGGLVSKINAVSEPYKERKRGAYIMKYARRRLMMDISEDDRGNRG